MSVSTGGGRLDMAEPALGSPAPEEAAVEAHSEPAPETTWRPAPPLAFGFAFRLPTIFSLANFGSGNAVGRSLEYR